jgi:hypothetical protein
VAEAVKIFVVADAAHAYGLTHPGHQQDIFRPRAAPALLPPAVEQWSHRDTFLHVQSSDSCGGEWGGRVV